MSKRCVILSKLLVHRFAEMYNEYNNIVEDSDTYTNTFFFEAKKKDIQKRNKRIGGHPPAASDLFLENKEMLSEEWIKGNIYRRPISSVYSKNKNISFYIHKPPH